MKPPRYLVYVVFVFLVVSIGLMFSRVYALISFYFHPVTPIDQARKISSDPENVTKHMRVNNTDYDINYRYFALSVPYVIWQDDIYLLTLYPDFQPLDVDVNDISRTNLNLSKVRILASDPVYRIDLEGIAKGVKDRTHKTVPGSYKYGLQMYEKSPDEAWTNGDLYIRKENEKIKMVIMCLRDPEAEDLSSFRKPGVCESYFDDGFLQYKVSYFDVLLPEWVEIEAKTRAMFKQFRAEAIRKSLDKVIVPKDRIDPRMFTLSKVQPERKLKRVEY